MATFTSGTLKILKKTPVRTFILYPGITLAWELFLNGGRLNLQPPFLILMLWGYLQYHLCGSYRIKHGGGGPGLDMPPVRLVTTCPYAWTRNPMYLGHILFLIGLALALKSILAALITVGTTFWFHFRILHDERELAEQFGKPYLDYVATVKRWIPGIL